jgi:hypothetical protein
MANEKLSIKDMFLRGIAILGLIALLFLGAWGIIQIAVAIPSFLAGVGSGITSIFHRDGTVTTTNNTNTYQAATSTTATSQPSGTQSGYDSQKGDAQKGATYSTGSQRNYYGLPDLSIRLVSAQRFGNRATVQFDIINGGTNVARAGWSFNYSLPLPGYQLINSGAQRALNPGDHILYTLTFDLSQNGYSYNNYWSDGYWSDTYWGDYRNRPCPVQVVVDPYNVVQELNEINNVFSFSI